MSEAYYDRGNSYVAQAGVTVKAVTMEHEPGRPTTYYAKGPDHPVYFQCTFDSFGNICDANYIVVYPSESGAHPLKRGDRGYFGDFAENYRDSSLPSISKAITIKSAREIAGMTQAQLSQKSGVAIRQIQRVENGESSVGNLAARNLLAIADALGVDPHNLI